MKAGPSTAPETTSTRQLRKRRKVQYVEEPAQEPDHESDLPVEAPKPKQPRFKLTGRLANLLDMPLDILYEIFGHLKPYDLLRLARSTKEFRRVLMSRNSISVWRAARSNLPGMPECPPDMTEPEYANLAFDPRCHYCGATGVRNADWVFRTRICGKCSKDHIEERYDFGHSIVCMTDSDESSHTCRNRDPQASLIVPTRPGRKYSRKLFLKAEYEQVNKELQAFDSKEEKDAYMEERAKFIEARMAHASQCETWNSTLTKDRSTELQQLKDERKQAIIDKLVSLGWKQDLDSIRYPDNLAEHRLVKQPHRLTERIWANIKPEIIKFMEEMRIKRLARERSELIVRRKQMAITLLRAYKNRHLPCTEVMPEPLDFCEFPEISALIEAPSDAELTADSFETVIPQLKELMQRWRDKITRRLTRVPHLPPTTKRHRSFDFFPDSEDEYDDILFDDLDMVFNEYLLGGGLMMPTNGKGKGRENETDEDDDDPADLESKLAKLKLATTIFTCKSCPLMSRSGYFGFLALDYGDDDDELGFRSPEPLTYPRILGHQCLSRTGRPVWLYKSAPDPCMRLDIQSKTRAYWSCKPLNLHQKMSDHAAVVVKEAGLDPETATSDEMDALDIRFVCSSPGCELGVSSDTTVKTFLMSWRQAVQHAMVHEYVTPEWRIIPSNVAAKAPVISSTEVPLWTCAHCRDLTKEPPLLKLEGMMAHLQASHSLQTPEINKDYYRDYSVPVHPFDNLNSVQVRLKKKVVVELEKPKGKSNKARSSGQSMKPKLSKASYASTSAKKGEDS
ncbi:hypothetical protein BDN72DRAFT_960384 [Pluteus cervinus]|uniref:Uncharacterized protein n=1 Tax=Pluteus cervinus TaxID=181527 RepID=A0ACD3ARS9_9AGAR|nr:hypothetical protein BDN72DRAFT_960384 [Pluteus cervinus]